MLAAPLSLAYAPDIYAVTPPHRDARNLTAANAFRTGAACTPNADHGCLDGTPYDYDTQFVCGSHTILKYSEEACCEQGRPFDTSAECAARPPATPPPPAAASRRFSRSPRRSLLCSFGRYCCTGSGQHGTHSYNDGKCDLSPPDQCACYDDAKTKIDGSNDAKAAITAAAAAAAPKPAPPQVAVEGTEGRQLSEDCLIDVSSPPEGGYQCTGPTAANDGMGCFNGWSAFAAAAAAAAAQILSPARKFSSPQISLRAKIRRPPPSPPSSTTPAGRTTTRRTSRRARGSCASASTACARRRRATSRTRSARRARRPGGSNPRSPLRHAAVTQHDPSDPPLPPPARFSQQPALLLRIYLCRYCCKIEGATPGDDYKIETSPCKCHRYGC